MKFEVYETAGGNNRWRLVSGNGQEVANSGENFASHSPGSRSSASQTPSGRPTTLRDAGAADGP